MTERPGDQGWTGDLASLRATCLTAVEEGMSIVDLVRDVLVPYQRTIGDEWLRAERSVASEHGVTAQVARVVMELELGLDRPRTLVPVLCITAEGDWHGLASRLLALVLADEGHHTAYLGSLTARELVPALRSLGDGGVVAISCSTVSALPGAARTVAVARDSGCPVVVGGCAFDVVPEAAVRLGVKADGDLMTASRQVLAATVPAPVGVDLAFDAVDELDLVAPTLIGRAAASLTGQGAPHELTEVSGYVVGLVRAALCFDLPDVVARHDHWLASWLTARELRCAPNDVRRAIAQAAEALLADPEPLRRAVAAA